jgi:hypothetical protein
MQRFKRNALIIFVLVFLNVLGYSWARCYFQTKPHSITEEYNQMHETVQRSVSFGNKAVDLSLEFMKLLYEQR